MAESKTEPQSIRYRIAKWLAWNLARVDLAAVTVRVDDSAGWQHFVGGPNDRDASAIAKQYPTPSRPGARTPSPNV